MSTSLQQRLLTAAAAYGGLNALLGSSPFRWYFDILQQGSVLPAVVAQQISDVRMYRTDARMKTGVTRVQCTIWGGQFAAGYAACFSVGQALLAFMDQWAGAAGVTGLNQYSNILAGDREALYIQTDSPIYQRVMDFQIFNDNTL